jgi:hypothetical protein
MAAAVAIAQLSRSLFGGAGRHRSLLLNCAHWDVGHRDRHASARRRRERDAPRRTGIEPINTQLSRIRSYKRFLLQSQKIRVGCAPIEVDDVMQGLGPMPDVVEAHQKLPIRIELAQDRADRWLAAHLDTTAGFSSNRF